MMNSQALKTRDLILVGGGHAHVQVLEMLAMNLPQDVQMTLVSDASVAYYSGMLPGATSGDYSPEEIRMQLRPLAQLSGARFIQARVTGLDPEAQELHLEGRPSLHYDLVSFNVGSSIRGREIPGVREFALKTRPISQWVEQLENFEKSLGKSVERLRVVVVGGGAAGVELALGLESRFSKKVRNLSVTLVDRGDKLLRTGSDSA